MTIIPLSLVGDHVVCVYSHGQHVLYIAISGSALLRHIMLTDSLGTEHARLKDHVASMEGGLEAKINEGGKLRNFPIAQPVFPCVSFLRGRLLSAFECEVLRLITHTHTHHGWCGSILVDDLGGCKLRLLALHDPTFLRLFLPAILAVT